MKLGEIKIETLKLMFTNYSQDIKVEMLEKLINDEEYRGYLINMPGAINRCFSDLEKKGVLPNKSFDLSLDKVDTLGAFIRFNLSSLIKDFFDIERIVYENDNGTYVGDCEYQREGDIVVLSRIEEGERYILIYKPKLERISAISDNEIELPIPEHIVSYIPYFVKGDLYRDDEPNEASEARNWYEAAMDAILNQKQNQVSKVRNIYSQTEI